MKKFLSLMLVLVFLFTLSACSKKETSSDVDVCSSSDVELNSSSEADSSTDLIGDTEPEDYAVALQLSINPQFKIYLDKNCKVLSVRALNDDAIAVLSNFRFYGDESFETIIDTLISKGKEKGYVKRNSPVNIEVFYMNKKAVNVEEMNNRLDNLIKDMSSKYSAIVKFKTPSDMSAPTSSAPAHTHSFSAATCTAPQKCSCGAINGKALGHKWQNATCKASKTCSVCNATEGNAGNHKYNTGKCIYCNEKQKINPKDGINPNGYYYFTFKDNLGDESLCVYQFYDSAMFLINIYIDDEEQKISEETKTYNGKTYFHFEEGDGFTQEYTLTDEEIILKNDDPESPFEVRMIVNYQYDLEVVYSSYSDIGAGLIFDLVE